MAKWNPALLVLCSIFELAVETVGIMNPEFCVDKDYNVTLTIVGVEDTCPYQPVTVRCIVKRSLNRGLSFLSWKCSEDSSEHLVFCDPVLDFDCEFGTLYNVNGSCECDDTVIVSEVTFIAKPNAGVTLTYSNGGPGALAPAIITALQTPLVNYTAHTTAEKGVQSVQVKWMTEDSTKTDIEYVLSMSGPSGTRNFTTKETKWDFLLRHGIHYEFTVISQRCGGNMNSKTSGPLYISFPVEPFTAATPGKSVNSTSANTSKETGTLSVH
jgi:hypothetical protein